MSVSRVTPQSIQAGLGKRKLPIIMLIDTSSSMSGLGIQQVNINLKEYIENLKNMPDLHGDIDLSIVTFNSSVDVLAEFVPLDTFTPPTLHTAGSTDLASGIEAVIRLIDQKRAVYYDQYKRTLFVLISDGNPDPGNQWKQAISKMNADHYLEKAIRIALGAGTDNAIDDTTLQAFIKNPETDRAVRITDMRDFRDFMKYLTTVSREASKGKAISTPRQAGVQDSVQVVSGQ